MGVPHMRHIAAKQQAPAHLRGRQAKLTVSHQLRNNPKAIRHHVAWIDRLLHESNIKVYNQHER